MAQPSRAATHDTSAVGRNGLRINPKGQRPSSFDISAPRWSSIVSAATVGEFDQRLHSMV